MKRTTIIAMTLMLAWAAAMAQTTAKQAFKDAPNNIFPTLNQNTRLDMIDYFESGLTTESTNMMNGKSAITALDDNSITVKLSESSSKQIAILPGDRLILITTVATPVNDSKIAIYTADWTTNVSAKSLSEPRLEDWLTSAGKKNRAIVESLVPFMLVEASYDPATLILTLKNNSREFLSDDIYETVEPYLLTAKHYKWDGKKFSKID